MANTRFILNETSYFGFGAREVLLDELKDRGYKRVFLVSDKSLVDAGVTDKVMNILEEGKVRYELYDDVKPNPSIDNVLHGYKKSRWFRPDVILAVGGGSSMDTAKAISILMTNPDRDDVVSLNGPSNTKKKGLPMIAMPTTAGTAAEVTINYVITDEEREVKMVCVDRAKSSAWTWALIKTVFTATRRAAFIWARPTRRKKSSSRLPGNVFSRALKA